MVCFYFYFTFLLAFQSLQNGEKAFANAMASSLLGASGIGGLNLCGIEQVERLESTLGPSSLLRYEVTYFGLVDKTGGH